MLLPRALTAAVGIPLLLWLIHLGSLPFLAFVTGVSVLALHEYGLILWLGGRGVQRLTAALGGGALSAAVALSGSGGLPAARGLAGAALTGLVLATVLREMLRPDHSLDRAALTLFGPLFIGWTLAHLALLRDLRPDGERLTLFLFLAIWLMDTAAYAAGRTLGRRRLAPGLSPGKTWEGAAAGLAAVALFAGLSRPWLLPSSFGPAAAVGLGLVVGVLGQVSDLAESMIKRAAGVKDSGRLLPGHGGVLDRFDSFLLSAPAMYYAVVLL